MPSISAVSIFVNDLAAAEKFYCGLLGFAVEARFGPEVIKLAHGSCSLLLCRCDTPAKTPYPLAAQVALGFAVNDAAAEARRLKAAGVEMVFDRPQDFPAGQFVAARDPAGNVVEFLQYSR
jgi:catechol 2,3-dioxygenase-like lactoylglutathione lyase family enzyme